MKYCQIWLTCENKAEAKKITQVLLDNHLVACIKQLPVGADYWWEGAKEHTNEILLVMESRVDLFNEIEKIVTNLHSYETFVLQAIPIIKISKKAQNWLNDNLLN